MTDGMVSHRKVARSSDRAFGLVFAAVFAAIGLWPLVHTELPRLWALTIAAAFTVIATLAPRLLAPLNLVWYRFGLVLHAVVNPVVMLLLYCTAIVPIGLIMRLRGKDLLRLKLDKSAPTYWIARETPAPAPKSMSKQY
jgi:predicted membrane metal-binding protein